MDQIGTIEKLETKLKYNIKDRDQIHSLSFNKYNICEVYYKREHSFFLFSFFLFLFSSFVFFLYTDS